MISGRNPDLLIGQHVIAAPYLKASGLEIIPTGYMLIDGGVSTTAAYMSGTQPIPPEKIEIAVCTAMAGTMLGLKMLYLDAGSGAQKPVSPEMIAAVRKEVEIPLITGGGIRTPEKAYTNLRAGADLLVVGNALEKDPALLIEIAAAGARVVRRLRTGSGLRQRAPVPAHPDAALAPDAGTVGHRRLLVSGGGGLLCLRSAAAELGQRRRTTGRLSGL